ncbi:unnamed protein product [Pseudo-nitzschia multistriata]|uniref:Uncharacterized protein n=1 Tax=Pseudo-nitzschia multistriata TaxID=183589 RepID=A0A448ZH12_9STRA|nr:unnamed protein product [Pseudo-nitzschia multistriata]
MARSSPTGVSKRFLAALVVALAAAIRPASSLLQASLAEARAKAKAPAQQRRSPLPLPLPLPSLAAAAAAPPRSLPTLALSASPNGSGGGSGRREVLRRAFLAAAAATASFPSGSLAFPNAVPDARKFADKTKRRGTPPKDLGILPRTTEGIDASVTSPRLRTCDGNPNCFSTTGDALLEDRQQYGVDFLVAPWVPPAGETDPIGGIAAVVASYEPGQGGIDGGGFALVKQTDNYLYYQFEALKKGFIDDVEFAVVGNDTTAVQVRSASRVGVTDFGVNAVRLNYISRKLRAGGWTIAEITPETHRDYWITANEAREATFDADRRSMD